MGDFEMMEVRVARLETQNRRFKQAGSLVAVLLVTALVLGQAKPAKKGGVSDVVKARRFVLIDEDGKKRGEWGTFPFGYGAPYLGLYDQKGDVRSIWSVDRDSSSFELNSHDSKVSLAARSESSLIGVWYPDVHAFLRAEKKGALMRLDSTKDFDSSTGPSLILSIAPFPTITLRDKNGKDRAILGAAVTVTPKTGVEHKHPVSSLLLIDKDGKVLFQAP